MMIPSMMHVKNSLIEKEIPSLLAIEIDHFHLEEFPRMDLNGVKFTHQISSQFRYDITDFLSDIFIII